MRGEPVRQRLASSYFVAGEDGGNLSNYLSPVSKLPSVTQAVTQYSSPQFKEKSRSIWSRLLGLPS
jgi:hypothetical protein